ncbi:MAG: nucleotide sugar dehydrogenase [Oscillospiraceae bacterium]|nr:nucleotide sugar dehydrogenase [Oscillospiraceae bacterium]
MNTQVNVVGLGYIGLPTALMLAAHRVNIVGTDCNEHIVETLRRGSLTFTEPGMEQLFRAAHDGQILFTTEYAKTDFYIISVPTPYHKETKKINTGYLRSAVESVLAVCEKDAVVVIESTVSPGTIDRCVRPMLMKHGRGDVRLAHAPERILPGNMIREMVRNDRTIGADSADVGERVKAIYASFCQGEIVVTDIRTAEMTKVVENAYRDVNIAFANELTKICRAGGMDVHEIIRIANRHPRVNILEPGPGVGGHCIPVDPWFLVGDFPEEARLIRRARDINDSMPRFVLERVRAIMREHGLTDFSHVGFYGIAYKENVNDTRESPTLQLMEQLAQGQEPLPKSYDPLCGRVVCAGQCNAFEPFLEAIDVLVVMVAHSHLKENWDKVRNKFVLDTRHCGLEPSCGNMIIYL